MAFGSKFSKDDAREQASGSAIWGFRDGETVVRFLEEMSEWTKYYEHFNQVDKAFYPCTGDKSSCPGCTSDDEREQRASKRYLSNGIEVKSREIRLFKVPSSLINSLDRRSDKYGTITDRDYEVFRSGTGLDTTYDLESGDKDPVNVKQFRSQFIDHQDALMEAFVAQWGAEPDQLTRRSARKRKPAERAPRRVTEPEPTVDDDPPSEPRAEKKVQPGEDVIREDDLRAMSIAALAEVYERYTVEFPHNLKKSDGDTTEIVDHLLLALEAQEQRGA